MSSDRNDDGLYLWLSVALIIVAFAAVLYFFPIIYKAPWAIFRFIEISILLLFSNYIMRLEYHLALTAAWERIVNGNWNTIISEMMLVVDDIMVNEYSGSVYTVILMGIFARRITRERFNKTLNFDELLEQLSRHFRFARCMIALDPTKGEKVMDFSKGPFRLKEEIITFLERHQAIGKFKVSATESESSYMIRDKAEAALLNTLGPKFKGFDALQDHEKWLCAAFIFFIKSTKYGESKEYLNGETILGDVGYYFNREGNLRRVNRLVQLAKSSYLDDPDIKSCLNGHAYVYGVIKQLFHMAKSKGVHPSLQFTWLFTKDRTLALVLEETGMKDERGAVIEVASPESGIECIAPRLHWTNETVQQTKLYEPACLYILDWVDDYLVNIYSFVRETDAKQIIQTAKDNRRRKLRRKLKSSTKGTKQRYTISKFNARHRAIQNNDNIGMMGAA